MKTFVANCYHEKRCHIHMHLLFFTLFTVVLVYAKYFAYCNLKLKKLNVAYELINNPYPDNLS